MTRVTDLGPKRAAHPPSKFKVNPLLDTAKGPAKNVSVDLRRLKNDKRREKRRLGRLRERKSGLVCYRCRKVGHDVKSCTATDKELLGTQAQGMKIMCYKCGSSNHTLYKCSLWKKSGKNDLPFASCFHCKKIGHLAVDCPENANGLYPNGGACHFCGSVKHLASNCKETAKKKIEKGIGTTLLGKMNLKQSADDDDMYITIMQDQKKENESKTNNDKKTKNTITFQ